MKYVVQILGEDTELDIERGADGIVVIVRGRRLTADLERVGQSHVYSLLLGDRSYEFSAHRRNGEYEIVLAGESYSAKVMDEHALLIAEASAGVVEAESGEVVAAPMPGVVVGIAVEEGALVEPGRGVVTLEAMKMENELRCERGGVVKEIRVKVGQGVAQGAALVVIE